MAAIAFNKGTAAVPMGWMGGTGVTGGVRAGAGGTRQGNRAGGVVAGGARPMWPIGMPPGMINWCSGILSKVVQTSVQGLWNLLKGWQGALAEWAEGPERGWREPYPLYILMDRGFGVNWFDHCFFQSAHSADLLSQPHQYVVTCKTPETTI